MEARMKNALLLIVSAISLPLQQKVLAQGTMYVSTLGRTPVGSAQIGADAWIAQPFFTGTNAAGYVLNSIQLLMDAASGSPTGFSVAIYSNPGNGPPDSSLTPLAGPEPTLGGVLNYDGASFFLRPRTEYSVVLTASTPTAQGVYNWSAANSFGTNTTGPGDPWVIPDLYYSSVNGSSWTLRVREDIFQLAINGTPAPEPPAVALGVLASALVGLGCWRRSDPRSF
jgi:hypothetical protein